DASARIGGHREYVAIVIGRIQNAIHDGWTQRKPQTLGASAQADAPHALDRQRRRDVGQLSRRVDFLVAAASSQQSERGQRRNRSERGFHAHSCTAACASAVDGSPPPTSCSFISSNVRSIWASLSEARAAAYSARAPS